MIAESIDVVVLSRDDGPLAAVVDRGIVSQRGVQLRVHRIQGQKSAAEECRWATIARARNAGKQCGTSQWLMFLDDDVELAPNCVARLLRFLKARRKYAALAANYRREGHPSGVSAHVAMGATLFRRSALEHIEFRFEDDRCECQCCCDDLRARGYRIAYLPTARARHLSLNQTCESSSLAEDAGKQEASSAALALSGRVLTCFNRRHYKMFLKRFIPSFRASGNREQIVAFCIDLYPSELRRLAQMWNVEVHALRDNGVPPQIRRLHEFPKRLAHFQPGEMAAFWDAGDVIFQDRIQGLWSLVDANHGKVLVVREPAGHPQNGAVKDWTSPIEDPAARTRIFDLLAPRPFFNGGFAAGTVGTLLHYCNATTELMRSAEFKGTGSWADQLAMNVYCHRNPDASQEINETWNYCLCLRPRRAFQIGRDGRYAQSDGGQIHAVHGNSRTLDWRMIARHYS